MSNGKTKSDDNSKFLKKFFSQDTDKDRGRNTSSEKTESEKSKSSDQIAVRN
jgi:hypothetical protein